MSVLGGVVLRAGLTLAALVAVLLVFVVETKMSARAGVPTALLLERGRRIRVGDRVVCTREGRTVEGRVAALGGQRVALRGSRLFVDGEPLERRPCRGAEALVLDAAVRARCFVERRGDRAWTIAAPQEGSQVELEATVPPARAYLLSDDRADFRADSRALGPLPAELCRTIVAELAGGSLRYRP